MYFRSHTHTYIYNIYMYIYKLVPHPPHFSNRIDAPACPHVTVISSSLSCDVSQNNRYKHVRQMAACFSEIKRVLKRLNNHCPIITYHLLAR